MFVPEFRERPHGTGEARGPVVLVLRARAAYPAGPRGPGAAVVARPLKRSSSASRSSRRRSTRRKPGTRKGASCPDAIRLQRVRTGTPELADATAIGRPRGGKVMAKIGRRPRIVRVPEGRALGLQVQHACARPGDAGDGEPRGSPGTRAGGSWPGPLPPRTGGPRRGNDRRARVRLVMSRLRDVRADARARRPHESRSRLRTT